MNKSNRPQNITWSASDRSETTIAAKRRLHSWKELALFVPIQQGERALDLRTICTPLAPTLYRQSRAIGPLQRQKLNSSFLKGRRGVSLSM